MSKVAICIPAYNNKSSLKKLLDSIILQTYKNYFVVITDDSVDNRISDMISEYASYSNFYYYKNVQHLGPTKNTNRAYRLAQQYNPDFIKIMHHDDYFTYPESLSRYVELLERNKEVDIVFSGSMQIENHQIIRERSIEMEHAEQLTADYRLISLYNWIGSPSATLVRNRKIYMDEALIWEVDIEWYFRILQQNSRFQYTREPLVSIGMSREQVTESCRNNALLKVSESLFVYQKHFCLHEEFYTQKLLEKISKYLSNAQVLEICRKEKDIYIYGAGKKGQECAMFLKNQGIEIQAFIVTEIARDVQVVLGKEVLEAKKVLDKQDECIIIIALSEKNRTEVFRTVQLPEGRYFVYT